MPSTPSPDASKRVLARRVGRALGAALEEEFTKWAFTVGVDRVTDGGGAIWVPEDFPRLYEPEGAPPGWAWMAEIFNGVHLFQTPRGWVSMGDFSTPAGRSLRIAVARENLGEMAEQIFDVEDLNRLAVARLLNQCPTTPGDVGATGSGSEAEMLLVALGANPPIPASAYSPDLVFYPPPRPSPDASQR